MDDLMLVFLMGVFGALHCVSMCGGLVMACSMRFGGGVRFSLVYNAGRVFTYIVLGLVMGLLGRALIAAGVFGGFQRAVPVAAGAFMVAVGLEMLGLLPFWLKRVFSGAVPRTIARAVSRAGAKNEKAAPLLFGMLNGLIPCGLLYAVGVKAASTGDPVKGALIMAALGAGNFAPMLFAGAVPGFMRRASVAFTVASAVLIIALGLKSIVMGTGFSHVSHAATAVNGLSHHHH